MPAKQLQALILSWVLRWWDTFFTSQVYFKNRWSHNEFFCHLLTLRVFFIFFGQQVARFALTGDSSLYILLPSTNTEAKLQEIEQKMTDRTVVQMIQNMKTASPQHIEVTLPKIKLNFQPEMNTLIKKLGWFIFCALLSFQPNIWPFFVLPKINTTHAFILCSLARSKH